MNDLLARVGQSVRLLRLLPARGAVLVAVSGGVDSMVLLHLLHRLAGPRGWRLVVAHFNHQLRGRASAADERLVRRTAARLGWPAVIERGDVRAKMRTDKLSLEMAARELRHEFLGRVADQSGLTHVALAHHADDQAELFFLRLARGAGGIGLGGMKPVAPALFGRRVKLVRPLLEIPKAQLRAWAAEQGIAFREDASNRTTVALRNRVRHRWLPAWTSEFGPAVVPALLRTMEIVGAEAECVEQLARRWLAGRDRGEFTQLHPALQRQIVRLQLLAQNVAPDFGLIETLRELPDALVSVDARRMAQRDARGRVRCLTTALPEPEFDATETQLELAAGRAEGSFGGLRIRVQVERGSGASRRRPMAGREIFDADRVGDRVTLRHWRTGDRFQPIGLEQPVKLQDLFTNAKIPAARRRGLVVATTAAGAIFWVEGLRMGERFKLDNDTRRRLKWHWRGR